MASVEDSVISDPNFAVICSFFEKFGDLFGVSNFTIEGLQHMLEDSRSVHSDLIDLHVKLMRKCGRKNVTHEKWEVALVKYCHCYSKVDAWEIERFGYKKSKLSVKISLLKRLLESQFDRNNKFKSDVNKQTSEDLRVLPIGKDRKGQLYWFQLDADLNLRIYREDQDEETFELVAREREELITLIDDLETTTNVGVKKEEDSTTPSDTGDSKDGELSQDVKALDDKLQFVIADVKLQVKQENDVDDKAAFVSQCRVKDEPIESKVDVVKFENVSREDTIKMEVDSSEIKEESLTTTKEKDVEVTREASESVRVKTELPVASAAANVLSRSGPIESKACTQVGSSDKHNNVEELKKTDSSSIAENENQSTALDLSPVGRVSVIKMIHGDKSNTNTGSKPGDDEKMTIPVSDKASSLATDAKVNQIVTDVDAKNVCVSNEQSVSRSAVKESESVERHNITSISTTNSQPSKILERVSTSQVSSESGDAKEKPRTERRTMPLKKREIPKDLDTIESTSKNIVCSEKSVSFDVANDLPKMLSEEKPAESSGLDKSIENLDSRACPPDSSKKVIVVSSTDVQIGLNGRLGVTAANECSEVVSNSEVVNDSSETRVAKEAVKNEECNSVVNSSFVPFVDEATSYSALNKSEEVEQRISSPAEVDRVKVQLKDDKAEQKVVDGKCVASIGCEVSVDDSSKAVDPCEKVREFDDTGQKTNEAGSCAEKADSITASAADKSEEQRSDFPITNCRDDAMDESRKEASSSEVSETNVKSIESKGEDVECASTELSKIAPSGEIKEDNDLGQHSGEIEASKVPKTNEQETSSDKSEEKEASGESEDNVAIIDSIVDKGASVDSTEPVIEEQVNRTESSKKGELLSEISSTSCEISAAVECNSNKDEICEMISVTVEQSASKLAGKAVENNRVAESKPAAEEATEIVENDSVKSGLSKDTVKSKEHVEHNTAIKEKTNPVEDVVPQTRSKGKGRASPPSCIASKKVVAKAKRTVVQVPVATQEGTAEDTGKNVAVEAKVVKNVAKKAKPERVELVKKESHTKDADKMDLVEENVDKARSKVATEKKPTHVEMTEEEGTADDVNKMDSVEDTALNKEMAETKPTPVEIMQGKCSSNDAIKTDSVSKSVLTETNIAVEITEVESKAEVVDKMDSVEDKVTKEEATDVKEPPTKKRRRGRGCRTVDDEDQQEPPAPPKRSSRLQAQRQKYEQEQRRVEEELQRQAMLVQHRLHEEWKKKQESKVLATGEKEKAKVKSKKKIEKVQQKAKVKKPLPPPPPQTPSGNNGGNGSNGGSSRSKKKKNFNPWDVSSESSSMSSYEEESSEEEEVEESEEELVFSEKSDHEFSPESDQDDDSSDQPAKVKRARTVKKVKSDSEDESSSDGADDDKPCSKCEKYDHPEWILLCDKCDSGYHTSCLRPPLMLIPDGDWFCPPCDHRMLIEKLREKFKSLDQLWKKKEREEMRKKRLAYVGISLDNVLKPDKKDEEEGGENDDDGGDEDDDDYLLLRKRSRRARKEVSYRFKEFDELIDSAIQGEPGHVGAKSTPALAAVRGVETLNDWSHWVTQQWDQVQEQHGFRFGEDGVLQETPKAGLVIGGKVLTNTSDKKSSEIIEKRVEETKENNEATEKKADDKDDDDDEEEEDDEEDKLVVVRQRKRKHRRLNDLDSPSDDDDSDEDFKGTSSESEVLSEDESGAGAEETDESWKGSEQRFRTGGRSRRNRGRRRSDDDFVCDESEDSDDNRRTVRRAAAKSVNYRELSDSDEYGGARKGCSNFGKGGRRPSRRIDSDDESDDSDWKKSKKRSSQVLHGSVSRSRKSRTIDSDDDDESESSSSDDEVPKQNIGVSRKKVSDDSDSMPSKKKSRMNVKDFELDSNEEDDRDNDDDDDEEEDDEDDDDGEDESQDDKKCGSGDERKENKEGRTKEKMVVESLEVAKSKSESDETKTCGIITKEPPALVGVVEEGNGSTNHRRSSQTEEVAENASLKSSNKHSVIKSVESVKKEILKQAKAPPKSQGALDKSSSLVAGDPVLNRTRSFPHHPSLVEPMLEPGRDEGSLRKLESLAKGPNADEPSYSERLRPPEYQNRPSPLKPSAMESYPARSSPSKLTLLDTYPSRLSPQPKLTPLEPYSAAAASPSSGGLQPYDRTRPPGPMASHFHSDYGGYPGAPGQYYPQNYPPPSGQYSHSPPMGGYHHPPNPYSQFHHHQHSPNYNYMPPGYNEQGSAPYQGPAQPPYGSYGNYSPQANNPQPSTQPNGRFSIDNLLQRRIEGAGEDDDFSTVNDLVSYITGSHENPL